MIVHIFNIKRRIGDVYTTGFKIQGLKLRFVLVLFMSLFFIGTSTSQGQDVAPLRQQTKSKKNAQEGHDFTSIKKVAKITVKVVIDGVVNEPFWETIEPLHSTQKIPNAGSLIYPPVIIRVFN